MVGKKIRIFNKIIVSSLLLSFLVLFTSVYVEPVSVVWAQSGVTYVKSDSTNVNAWISISNATVPYIQAGIGSISGNNQELVSFSWYLKRTNYVSGSTFRAYVYSNGNLTGYATTGGQYPVNGAVADIVSNNVETFDGSETLAGAWLTFTFDSGYILGNMSVYAFALVLDTTFNKFAATSLQYAVTDTSCYSNYFYSANNCTTVATATGGVVYDLVTSAATDINGVSSRAPDSTVTLMSNGGSANTQTFGDVSWETYGTSHYGNDAYLYSVTWRLSNVNTASSNGYVRACVWLPDNVSGGKPNNGAVPDLWSDNFVDVSVLTSSMSWVAFTFDSTLFLNSSMEYCFGLVVYGSVGCALKIGQITGGEGGYFNTRLVGALTYSTGSTSMSVIILTTSYYGGMSYPFSFSLALTGGGYVHQSLYAYKLYSGLGGFFSGISTTWIGTRYLIKPNIAYQLEVSAYTYSVKNFNGSILLYSCAQSTDNTLVNSTSNFNLIYNGTISNGNFTFSMAPQSYQSGSILYNGIMVSVLNASNFVDHSFVYCFRVDSSPDGGNDGSTSGGYLWGDNAHGSFIDYLLLFILIVIPTMVFSEVGAKGGWGMQGFVCGLTLGVGLTIYAGILSYWFITLIAILILFMVMTLKGR